MWARMQKDRNQRGRSGSMFNLGDDVDSGEEVLTHRGQALDTSHEGSGGEHDDEDNNLNAEVVEQLHFGGGGAANSRTDHSKVRILPPLYFPKLMFHESDEGLRAS